MVMVVVRKFTTRHRKRSSYRSSLPTWEGVDWMGYACPGEAATLTRERQATGEYQSYDVIATNQLTVIAVITQRYLASTVLKALQMLAYFISLTREPGRGCRESSCCIITRLYYHGNRGPEPEGQYLLMLLPCRGTQSKSSQAPPQIQGLCKQIFNT